MTKAIAIACSMLAGFALLTAAVAAESRGEEPDLLCRMLFEGYVVGGGKVNASTERAAAHIVAERGRNTGYWRDVLRKLRESDEQTERGCVLVLGKMLEVDAIARDFIRERARTGKTTQCVPSIELGSEVVDELIARGRNADRFRIDSFAVALARARVPAAAALFRTILQDDAGKDYMPSAEFHAAVGLAQLGDPAGFRWLIENSSDPTPTIANAWPERYPSLNLDVSCLAALQDLSGQSTLRTRQDCETWWKLEGEASPPSRRVRLVEQ